jgi:hypothetical protein
MLEWSLFNDDHPSFCRPVGTSVIKSTGEKRLPQTKVPLLGLVGYHDAKVLQKLDDCVHLISHPARYTARPRKWRWCRRLLWPPHLARCEREFNDASGTVLVLYMNACVTTQ